uniref:Uncharacterized protein At5g05190 family n=1 Tax=Cajanus cajan TaxID=3821 RepID=A0A151SMX8_CAJCA|nr:Uncharacterized protein At5g05190 family [Cajanus cajan]
MEDSAMLRLVRCPKCQNVLPELANYTVYQCGGCDTVLRGKLKGSEGGRLWEATDEGQGGGAHGKPVSFLGKGVVDLGDNSDVDVRSNGGFSKQDQRRDLGKPNKGNERFLDDSKDGDEKGILENGFDVNKDKRGKSIGREHHEQKPQMGRDQFYGRMSNWPNGERGEMEGFWRKPQADIEGVRFPTLNYPEEGSSNSYSSFPYGEQWRNCKDMDGMNRVQHLEQDRAEILRKLDELSNQLSKSSELANNPKEKVLPEGSHPLPHQFPQKPMHPYFPGHYVDTGPESYDPYALNAMLHPPSCSCFRCYDNKRRVPANGSRHCLPIAGGSPFFTCHNCFELLQLPKKTLVMEKNHKQKMRCGVCSSEIKFSVINKKLVICLHSETEDSATSTRIDDTANEVVNSHLSHSRVDRESPVLAGEPSLNSSKSREMQSFHSSSSPSTSDDENSPEVMNAPSEATNKSIHQPSKSSDQSPPPSGSCNNNAVSRLGKGNQSNRSDQGKENIEKNASRKNSLKEVVLASEMDVHDYSNTGVSQDSGDASGEHDHPRSNKRGESFLANIIKRDSSKSNVTVNGQPIPDRVIKKAEKLAGPIQPGNYWYDFRAGFWGVMDGPCLGIIMPFIEEFQHPMPDKCAGGNTGVFVNGRELHQKDLDLLSRRGLPRDSNRSYIIEISGRILDEDTGEELDSLGKLAPTVEKERRGFGMKVPRAAA